MTNSVLPLSPVPSQSITTTIADQRIRLTVSTKAFGLFVDVYVNDALIIGGVLARNLNRIVRSVYLGFVGDIFFYDTQGTDDPTFDGLGSRFLLLYQSA